ncbi:MAG: D-alanyl-D-alanine carboxypeptidase, partial [Clostridia bacterium]|nr:D-alanyl-D-alanine carboxypeptidase [Clostridia bacterium]
SAYLVDYATGEVLYKRNENEKLPIASMVKIMTANLTLEAIERGELSLDDDVTVSENAARMGGSQVFLDANSVHKVGDLLRSVIVASANDSCVALAEHISGSVEGFVNVMNTRAKELGMQNTHFVNCTGLPAPNGYSCAKDCVAMFSALIKHPVFFEYAKVWMEDFKHPSGRTTSISNTNKLVKFYNGCDGGKTGFTNEAKFCLTATAKRNDMRVIAVVIGADSSKNRNAAVSQMFDYAFANFENRVLQKANEPIPNDVEIVGGKQKSVLLTIEKDLTAFAKKNENVDLQVKFDLPSRLKAPLKVGDAVGKAYVVKNGVVVKEEPVIVKEAVDKRSFFDAIKDATKNWGIQAAK